MPPQPRVTREALVAAAAELLATDGPRGLTARALARAVGTSTMAVYTHFGGMPAVAHAVIEEAFARLDEHLAARLSRVEAGGDPLAELRAIAVAYRDNALANPHLYAVMFGGPGAIGRELSEADLAIAQASLRTVAQAAARARDGGHLLDLDEWELARRFWAAGHGAILLELGGYLGSPDQAEATYLALTDAVLRGLRP